MAPGVSRILHTMPPKRFFTFSVDAKHDEALRWIGETKSLRLSPPCVIRLLERRLSNNTEWKLLLLTLAEHKTC